MSALDLFSVNRIDFCIAQNNGLNIVCIIRINADLPLSPEPIKPKKHLESQLPEILYRLF